MNDNFALVDTIYRSRLTLLDILERRGYEVESYRKFSPVEAAAAVSSLPGLSFTTFKKEKKDQVCQVRYINNMTRPKLEEFFDDIPEDDLERTEVVVMMQGPVADAHHVIALKQYMKMRDLSTGEKVRSKLRISFFSMETIVVNPLTHVLVPPHEIVPEEMHKKLMSSMYITSKTKFPEIKFHIDPIARCIGAVPGDIVKITRPSASSGIAVIYRVCAP
jgi:DNA-directed RNA polymerase subunit H